MHIAKVVDFVETPTPSLVMEYFPLGNLEDQNREWPITMEETLDLLFQCLVALNYLHLRNVGHRDLKPANLLVEGRNPLSVKLADFGLAKVETAKSHMKSFVGTLQYCAPEVYLGKRYTPSVDLWALGVIVLEYAYGLPAEARGRRRMDNDQCVSMKKRGAAWCQCLVDEANDWDLDPLIDLLTVAMLRIDPEERLPAGQCLKKGAIWSFSMGTTLTQEVPYRQSKWIGKVGSVIMTTLRLSYWRLFGANQRLPMRKVVE